MIRDSIQTIYDRCPEDQRFSVEDAKVPIEPGCNWIKTTIKEGQGKFGTVYRVCKECENEEPQCVYVVKHIERNSSVEEFRKHFQQEVQMHILLRDSGISPNVYDAFICGDDGYIVLDKKDYSIKNYAFKLLESLKKPNLVFDILDQLQTSVIRLLGQLHSYSYIHNDPHLDNFMIDVRDSNLSNWRNPQIIDFGQAKKVDSPEVANQLEPQKGVEMSFDLLKREVLEKERQMNETDPDIIARQKILAKGVPEAPRKGKIRPASEQKPEESRRRMFDEDVMSSPPKKTKQLFDDFDSPVKKPFSSNLFSTPTNTGNNLFGSMDDDSSFESPVKPTKGLFETPTKEKEDDFQSPTKTPSSNLFNKFEDSDDEDSFLSRRFYPFRIGGEDRSVDMVDPEYYNDSDYDPEEENLGGYEAFDY